MLRISLPRQTSFTAGVAAFVLFFIAAPLTSQVPTTLMRDVSPGKMAALEALDDLADEIRDMSMTLWEYSEIALLEHRSAEYLAGLLEAEGFEVETGVAGMPTAFVATFRHGSGGPVLGVLAEYDALPGVGNAPVPHREARADGVTSGQGCGHNLFGAGSVGAAIAIKRAMADRDIPGEVRLFGTPAEETVVGKVYMANAGVFDDVDATLVWHPMTETRVTNASTQAMNNFTVEFRGQAAHSAADPWNGRSALDAVEMMNYGANLMREHVQPSTRIHYVMPNAGEAPNVVPEYAKAWYYVRDTLRAHVDEYYEWLLDIAAAAAQATRTEHEVSLITGVHALLLNRPLQEAMQANLEAVGGPRFPDAFQAWGREMQAGLDIEQAGLDVDVQPLATRATPAQGGSTDVAEVSWITPTVQLEVTSAPKGVPWHSWATSASHGTEWAAAAADVAARVMAMTGVDLLTDPDLLAAAREAHGRSTAGRPWKSAIPKDQKPPLP
ncbi:amidohydrolase [Candidatus Palauibacter sp.]|uniref:amidohydrolase n=1 Tax=Candidatus Palauibacter sp. TaxID=3101350 RepID=UPI003B02C4CD